MEQNLLKRKDYINVNIDIIRLKEDFFLFFFFKLLFYVFIILVCNDLKQKLARINEILIQDVFQKKHNLLGPICSLDLGCASAAYV